MTSWWDGLTEIAGEPSTRASAGHEHRAGQLRALVGDAHAHLAPALGTSFEPLVVVAAPDDWDEGEDAAPYGIPYALDDEPVVVIPATPEGNPLVATYAAAGTREEAARFADLIAVHELGHLHVREMGLDLPQGWLGELLATYLSYDFLRAHRPDDAELWLRLSRAHAATVSPEHRPLETLDELYFGVGPETYIWYQDTLTERVAVVHDRLGLDFVLGLRVTGLTRASDTATTLGAAESLCPGFLAWAESLRRG